GTPAQSFRRALLGLMRVANRATVRRTVDTAVRTNGSRGVTTSKNDGGAARNHSLGVELMRHAIPTPPRPLPDWLPSSQRRAIGQPTSPLGPQELPAANLCPRRRRDHELRHA